MPDYVDNFRFLGEKLPIKDSEARSSLKQLSQRLTNVEGLAGETADELEQVEQTASSNTKKINQLSEEISKLPEMTYSETTETITYK